MTDRETIMENRRKWVEALRSGQYRQGKQALASLDSGGTRYCCLGVACEVLGLVSVPSMNNSSVLRYADDSDSYLPQVARDLLGFEDNNPVVVVNGSLKYLAELNDNGVSFAEIADLIEAEFLTEVAA